MTVRHYHRDQAGAPPIPSFASTIAAGFAAFKAIMKASLVSGYGTYPAAGWELIAEEANCIVFRNGTHSGYLGVSIQGEVSGARVYLLNSFTGIVSGVPTGAGRKTGTAAGETVPHKLNLLHAASNTNSMSWSVIADNRTFCLHIASNNSGTTPSLTEQGHPAFLYAGEDSSGNFIAMGGTNIAGTATPGFDSTGFTALKDPVSGLLVDAGSITVHAPGLDNNAGLLAANRFPAVPEINLTKAMWAKLGSPLAGYLRGICMHPGFYRTYSGYIGEALGVSGVTSRTVHSNPIPLGDANLYFLVQVAGSVVGHFRTDNPSFW